MKKEKNGHHPPAFLFYPADYLADAAVQSMSISGEGCYIRLMSFCWREGFIPSDRDAIVRLCKGYDGPGIEEAISCFSVTRKKQQLTHKRLELERYKQINNHKVNRDNGKEGAEKRWRGHSQAIATPMAIDGSSSSLSSSSSISNPEDKTKDIKAEPEAGSGPHVSPPPDPILAEFEAGFWSAYPVKLRKQDALKAYRALRKKTPEAEIESAFMGYLAHLKAEKVYRNFDKQPMHPATFLRSDRWREYVGIEYRPKL